MAATQALLTHADLHSLRLRSRNGRRFELIDGELIVLPGPPPWHQHFVSRLIALIDREAERQGIPVKTYPSPMALYLDPKPEGDEVQPDLTVVLPDDPVETRHDPDSGWALVGTPWSVVEIMSRTTWRDDLGKKKRAYARAGVGLYLFLDLKDAQVLAFAGPRPDGTYAEEHTYGRHAALPWAGGALDLSQLPWDEVPPGVYD
jgi:Uma2 family endonuclease